MRNFKYGRKGDRKLQMRQEGYKKMQAKVKSSLQAQNMRKARRKVDRPGNKVPYTPFAGQPLTALGHRLGMGLFSPYAADPFYCQNYQAVRLSSSLARLHTIYVA